jgi:hypothetical protein
VREDDSIGGVKPNESTNHRATARQSRNRSDGKN